jgi:flagellar hook-length control protein FliK
MQPARIRSAQPASDQTSASQNSPAARNPDRPERADRRDNAEAPDRPERQERPGRPDRPDQHAKDDRPWERGVGRWRDDHPGLGVAAGRPDRPGVSAGSEAPFSEGDVAVDPALASQGDVQGPAQPLLGTAVGTLDAALAAQIAAEADDGVAIETPEETTAETMIAAEPAAGGAPAQPVALVGMIASPNTAATAEGETAAAAGEVASASIPVSGPQTGAQTVSTAQAMAVAIGDPAAAPAPQDISQPAGPPSNDGAGTPTRPGLAVAAGALPEGAPAAAAGTGTEAVTPPAPASEKAMAAVDKPAELKAEPVPAQGAPEARPAPDAGARFEAQRAEAPGRSDAGPAPPAGRYADLPAAGAPEPRAEVVVTPRSLPPGAIPVEIGLRALQGLKEFQIRLDPAELGRVDVKLEIGDDKSVTARVVVDRVETLHLLQRDARTLERAFEQAGLKSSEGGIDITLRDPGQQSREDRRDGWPEPGDVDRRGGKSSAVIEAPAPLLRRIHAGGLDLSI